MTVGKLGPWVPLGLAPTIDLLADAPFRWWIGGGLALELHVGRSWRRHSDTDVGLKEVIPALGSDRRDRLAQLLPVDHPWQSLLRAVL